MITPDIKDAIIKISRAQDFDAAWHELKKGAEALELIVPYYVSAYAPDASTTFSDLETNQHLVYKDEYPDAFNDFYNQGGFINYDLAVDWIANQNRSALWSEIFRPVESGEVIGKRKEFYRTCQDMASKAGAMISFNDISILGLTGMAILTDSELSEAQGNRLLAERMETMEILATVFHNSRSLKTQSLKHFKLTDQEQEILRRICSGQRTKQIAYDQGKFVGVIEKQIANVKRKLGVHTLPQAVTKALYFDLIGF